MVCKEEVFAWFRNLKGSKRIEAMCGFLNMCYPLELRFYGTCLEDLARKDFYTIRDEEAKANNIVEVSKIRNIHDPYMRSRVIVVLSLLNSTNSACAKELFKVLSEEVKIETLAALGFLADPKLVEHYMLLLTLASHHPAFTFSEQTFLCNLSIALEKCAKELIHVSKYQSEETCLSSPVFPYVGSSPLACASEAEVCGSSSHLFRCPAPVQQRSSDSLHSPVHITSLKVKGPHRKQCIRIRVAWSNNKVTDTLKTPKELLNFHQKLIELFPAEAKASKQEKFVVSLSQQIIFTSLKSLPDQVSASNCGSKANTPNHQVVQAIKSTPQYEILQEVVASSVQLNVVNENIISAVSEYIQQLNSSFPDYVYENEFVTSFFMPSHPRSGHLKSHRFADAGPSDMPPRNPRLRSLTIYNSQMSENSSGHRPETRQRPSLPRKLSENSSCGRASPLNSPMQSPNSSPYTSPINSETNSRAASPWSHIAGAYVDKSACNAYIDPSVVYKVGKEALTEPWDPTRSYKIEELQAMPIEELESLGIIPESSKGKKILDPKSLPNGIVNPFLSKSSSSAKKNLLNQQPLSDDSSPAGSEYSSPPQSPLPGEMSSSAISLNSGAEENADKKSQVKTQGPNPSNVEEPDSSQIIPDSTFKSTDDEAMSLKGNLARTTISVIPFPAPYTSIISQMPPPQNMKTAYLPIPCRTTNPPQHISPGGIVFENQFSRVPLPSALTFLPGAGRPHAVTPDRVLSTPNIPISTVSPFPVVTSGSATVPIATCCITTHKSNNVTVVSNSSVSSHRHGQKNPSMPGAEIKPMQLSTDVTYVTSGFVLTSAAQYTPASCSCFTTSSTRPSPAPSPSMSPGGAPPQASGVPVSLPYIMPYVFHQAIPFLQPQAPANGYVPQPGMPNPGQTFSYALPNGLTAIPHELIYPTQTFTLQSPTQGTPGPVTSPVSQCYGAFPQTAAVPMKMVSCYNCGRVGHRGSECKEPTMDDLNKSGKFQLNYAPVPKIPDAHE